MNVVRKTYVEALAVLRFLIGFGLLIIAAGTFASTVGLLDTLGVLNVFNDPLGNTWSDIKRAALVVGGMAAVISGVVLMAIARIVEAVVDTATNTAELVTILRQKN